MPVTFSSYRLGPGQRVSYKTVPPPWDWLLRRENELEPRRSRSQIIFAVLVPPLYVAVQAPALIVTIDLSCFNFQLLCKQSKAGFDCSCVEKKELACTPINECEQTPSACSGPTALCSDVPSGFECTCENYQATSPPSKQFDFYPVQGMLQSMVGGKLVEIKGRKTNRKLTRLVNN